MLVKRLSHGPVTAASRVQFPYIPFPKWELTFIKLIMKDLLSELNVNVSSLVRSGVVLLLGAPVVLGAGGFFNELAKATKETARPDGRSVIIESYQTQAAEACVKFLVSKADSKLEREAKTELDEVFGGEVNYKEVCTWTFS